MDLQTTPRGTDVLTERYNIAVDNMEQLLYNARKYLNCQGILSEQDIKQLERDIFYLKLFKKLSVKETTGGCS